jgi:hypothetical protein
MMNWKGGVISGCGLILRHSPSIWLEGPRVTMKNLSQDSQCLGQDLDLGCAECETGVLTS